uniref:SAC domain-containing protein n=1 Tax=Plectus sambesii TaxID=2011161 RepID=A0A914W547_9BILA
MRPYRYVTVYESGSRFYVVGSEASENKYAVLKIDRTEHRSLTLSDGGHLYSRSELTELLAMLTDASIAGPTSAQKSVDRKSRASPPGLTEKITRAYGLIGVVRFLEGYYMIFVTKATVVAHFGYHKIYKIEDVSMLYLPSGTNANADDQRYLKLFQSVDLTTNFYFSYSYDLSRTLQENSVGVKMDTIPAPEKKFVWNNYLLEPLKEKDVSERWMLRIVHGYVGQTTIELPAAKLSLTLIARRSSEFAGTR